MEYFEIFDLKPNISVNLSTLKKEYYKKSRAAHPDKNIDDPKADEKYAVINIAYGTLSNRENLLTYLLEQNDVDLNDASVLDQFFLMEMMELNESIMMDDNDSSEVREEVQSAIDDIWVQIEKISNWQLNPTDKSLAHKAYAKLKYLNRLSNQV